MNRISNQDRELIDAAIAAGRVRRVDVGRPKSTQVQERRREVLRLAQDGSKVVEIAAALGRGELRRIL